MTNDPHDRKIDRLLRASLVIAGGALAGTLIALVVIGALQ